MHNLPKMENMGDQQGDDAWKTQQFRQNVRTKIEEAIRQSGNPTTKSVVEMESHVFQKANTKEEYLGFVARLIIHVREMNSKKMPPVPNAVMGGVPQQQPQVNPMQQPPQPGQQAADPMSALKNMAGQANNPMQQPPPGQPQQMTAALLGSGGTISQCMPPQMQGGAMGQPLPGAMIGPGGVPTAGIGPQGMNPNLMQQQQQARFMGSGGMLGPQQMMQRPQMMPQNPQMLQKLRQQQAAAAAAAAGLPPNVGPGQIQMQGNFNEAMFIQQQSPMSQQFQGHSPVPASLPNQGPNSNQSAVPSPVGLHPQSLNAQMNSNFSAQMTPSPAVYGHSPNPQINPSPIPNYPVRTPGVASPGSALNTPMAAGAVPSPIDRATQEQMYLEKRKQLAKYIEPLKKWIEMKEKENKFTDKKDNRMKSLLDILQDSGANKRCTLDVLLKCEQVLERMNLIQVEANESKAFQHPVQPFPQIKTEQNICQPLIDALTNLAKSPMFNHVLEKAFGPPLLAMFGQSVNRTPVVCPKKRKIEEDPAEISDVLQGEIARLDQKFKVQLDPVQHMGSRTVNLICQLDDKNLPCVPSISITVPENYPEKPPQCHTTKDEYESTSILQNIQQVFTTRMITMPQKFSITSLLDTWEMSVRQACASKPIIQET